MVVTPHPLSSPQPSLVKPTLKHSQEPPLNPARFALKSVSSNGTSLSRRISSSLLIPNGAVPPVDRSNYFNLELTVSAVRVSSVHKPNLAFYFPSRSQGQLYLPPDGQELGLRTARSIFRVILRWFWCVLISLSLWKGSPLFSQVEKTASS